jgi:hypothetical protein
MYYYEVPGNEADKQLFYGDLFNILFKNVSKNANYSKIAEVNETYQQGGFYRYDLNDAISVLSLNTIYFNLKNTEDLDGASLMLAWLKSQLANATEEKRFIIQMHIFPGLFYLTEIQTFWYDNFLEEFLSTVHEYQQKIIFITGAHIHFADLRAPLYSKYPDMNVTMIISPSVSPIFSNNPGYSIVDFGSAAAPTLITRFTWNFL